MTNDPFDDLLRDAAQSYNAPPDAPRDLMWARIEHARAAAAPTVGSTRGQRWLRTAAGIAAILVTGIVIGRTTQSPPSSSSPGRAATTPAASSIAAVAPRAGDASEAPGVEADITQDLTGTESDEQGVRVPRLASRGDARAGSRRTGSTPGARASYGVPPQGAGAVGDGTDMSAYRLAVVEHLARTEVLLTGFRAQSRAGSDNARTAGQQFAVLSRDLLQNTRLLLAAHATDDPTLTRLLEDLELVLMQISQYAAEGRHGDLDAINQSLDRRNVLPKLRSTIPAGAPAPAGT